MKRNLSMRGFCRLIQVVKYFYRIFALFTLSKLLSMILHLVVCTWSILTDQYRNQWCFTIGFWRVCLSVCLFRGYRSQFWRFSHETWHVGPLRGWEDAFFWILEKSSFFAFLDFFKSLFWPFLNPQMWKSAIFDLGSPNSVCMTYVSRYDKILRKMVYFSSRGWPRNFLFDLFCYCMRY